MTGNKKLGESDYFIYGRIHYHFHQKFSWEKLFIFQFFKMPRFHGWNGPLGVDWSLNGLSAITRCRATQAQDGLIDVVDFIITIGLT